VSVRIVVLRRGGGLPKGTTSNALDPAPDNLYTQRARDPRGMAGVPTYGSSSVLDPGSSLSLSPTLRGPRDRRYGLAQWQNVRRRVLDRDLWRCRVVAGCPTRASVADHIIPAFPGMPDALFFGMANLRAACRRHNLARGFAASIQSETTGEPSAVVTGDYS